MSRITSAIDDRFTVVRKTDRHPLARSENDEGAVPPATRMERMILVLAPDADQQKALEELLADQQNPESPQYRQWLTPQEFGSRFGVSDSDIGQIVRWLERHGFEVEPVEPSRRSIVFSGSAAQVASAFHTQIHIYNVNGERHHANAAAPRIPEALAGIVEGIASLHDFHAKPMHTRAEWTANSGNHYLAPADFATVYDVAPLYAAGTDGTGQSIAIVGRTNIHVSDVQTFRSTFGLPANSPAIVINGTDPGIVSADEEGEAALDVELSGAVAKKAAIQLVVSASTNTTDGVDLSAQYIVSHNLAPLVSVSFGNCEAALGRTENQFWNGLWQQAAAQGMTVLVSSGDSGAAGCDDPSAAPASYGRGVNALCSSPYSTCVGGTEFNDMTSPGQYWGVTNSSTYGSALGYIPEAAWNESAAVTGGSGLWASGGGASAVYAKPSWQTGPGVPADGWRDVPDVSLNASSHDASLMYMNGSFYTVSGTSVATPSFAGIAALAAQRMGARLGNVNPVLYTLAAKQAAGGGAVFHDVTTGNNAVPGVSGYGAGAGYDLAAGLGSLDAAALIGHWGDGATGTGSFQVSVTPLSISVRPGASASATLQLVTTRSFNSSVGLSVAGVPSWLTATWSLATIPADYTSSTLTLYAGSQAPAGSISLTVTASGGGVTRTHILIVNVVPACTYNLDATDISVPAAGGSYTARVTGTTGCAWTAVSNNSWITVTSGASGTGNGTVNYSVAANTATGTRPGAVVIAGITLAVTQAAAAPQFSLNPSAASFSAAGGTAAIAVSAVSPTASWTAVSNASWITITSGATGAGSRSVGYSVAANTGSAGRTGTITIVGLTFTVTQNGNGCTYALGNWSARATVTGFMVIFPVIAPPGCPWTATSNAPWLAVTSGATGSGNGTAVYSAAENTTGASRTATATIAGIAVDVTEGR